MFIALSAPVVGVAFVQGLVDREARGADRVQAESVAPTYEIENTRLMEFLAWVAHETGRKLTFVDAHARDVATRTTLHGSVNGLRPLEALDQVLSTTSLSFELRGKEIRIASRR